MEPTVDPLTPVLPGQGDQPVEPEQENQFKQFQVDLATRGGNFVIAASDTVNDLVEQAKYWLGATDSGMQLQDNQVQTVTLQELDPATGAYVDGLSLPVEDKKDVLTQVHKLGAR